MPDAAGFSISDDTITIPPEFTDEALALRFTEQHKDRLRYVAAWGRWLIRERPSGGSMRPCTSFDLARAVCRQAAAECNEPRSRPASQRQDGCGRRAAREG